MKLISFYSSRNKFNPLPVLALLAVAAAFVAGILLSRALNREPQTDAHISYIGELPVIEDFIDEGVVARPGTQREIKYLVIHETDNFAAGADAAAHNSFIHNNSTVEPLSWHYTVDDHQVYHHLPDNEAAYHAGDKMEKNGGNLNGIGIEMCVNEDGDYGKTMENTVKLCARLLVEYDLKPKVLRKHEDFSGKVCPAKLIAAGRWDEFCERVETAWKEMKSEEQE